jgi:hypothetical protein
VPILITCSELSLSNESDKLIGELKQEPVAVIEEKPIGLLLEVNGKADLGLSLYKNTLTRDIVISFYNSLTHSEAVTIAVLSAAEKYSISPALAFAVSGIESKFDARAVNVNQISIDRGLFQLNSLAFPEMSEADFFSPDKNAEHGLKYLRYCLDRGENEIVALAMYNAGEQQVSASGAPKTTLEYISKILGFRDELQGRFRDAVLAQFTT